MRLYEGMFLVDSAQATSDWKGITKLIKSMLKRAKAEIVSIRKWDDRALAYPIEGKSRGTYILCYFRAPGGKIAEIEREVRLSERVMRVLILNAENMTQEDIEKDTPLEEAEKRAEKFAAEAAAKAKTRKAKAAEAAEAVEEEREDLEEGEEIAEEDEEPEDKILSSFELGLDEAEESGEEAEDINSNGEERDDEEIDRDGV